MWGKRAKGSSHSHGGGNGGDTAPRDSRAVRNGRGVRRPALVTPAWDPKFRASLGYKTSSQKDKTVRLGIVVHSTVLALGRPMQGFEASLGCRRTRRRGCWEKTRGEGLAALACGKLRQLSRNLQGQRQRQEDPLCSRVADL